MRSPPRSNNRPRSRWCPEGIAERPSQGEAVLAGAAVSCLSPLFHSVTLVEAGWGVIPFTKATTFRTL
jgi:hypothetical protein